MVAPDMPSPRLPGRDSVLAELLQSGPLDPVVEFVELLVNDAHGVGVGTAGESALLSIVTDLSQLPGVSHHVAVQIAFGEKAGRQGADRTVRMLVGQRRRGPDDRRIRRGIDLLRRTTARTPTRDRPPLLCILAWLHWARGQRPIALSYLGEAQRIDPHNALVRGLCGLLATRTPEWLAR